jgi:hypothetical protein
MMLYEKKSSLLNLSFKEAVFTSSDSRGVASRAIVKSITPGDVSATWQ